MNAARRKRAAKLLADLQPLIEAAEQAHAAGHHKTLLDLANDEYNACGDRRITQEAHDLNSTERDLRHALHGLHCVKAMLISVKGNVK